MIRAPQLSSVSQRLIHIPDFNCLNNWISVILYTDTDIKIVPLESTIDNHYNNHTSMVMITVYIQKSDKDQLEPGAYVQGLLGLCHSN